ncbi:MAG TPA: LemA family protein [Candidatus Binatia bacterium]|jgi:LemA protein|nr:LemA family protein [Candidatus Binatia bacterium]
MTAYALLGAIVVVSVWVGFAYNRLVRHAALVREGWSGIDVQLERRHDLVPNLVVVVQSYAKHERELLTDVARTRAGKPTAELEARENALTSQLRGVLALVEAYPALRADTNFLTLQQQLVDIEEQLQMARRYYNGTVRDNNVAVESFPSNLVARAFGFGAQPFFQVESATMRDVPSVTL